MILRFISSLTFLSFTFVSFGQTYRVSTVPTYINNNGQTSIAFNITTGSKAAVIKEIGCWINSGTSTVAVYYKTSAINETASWTAGSNFSLLSSQSATGSGTGPVPVAQNLNLMIPANASYGIIIHSSNSLGYLTWTSTYPAVISDGTISLECAGTAGWGGAYPSMSFNPRSFLGYVDYGMGAGQNDAGVSTVTHPGVPVCQAYSDSIMLALLNAGLKDLDSVMIGWRINDTTLTPVKWKGKIKTDSTGSATLKYFRNLRNGDTLWAWTYEPNGVPDSFPLNDTLFIVFIDGLSGTYTVGDTSMDFINLDSAISELNLRGVCTPVTFILKDTIHYWRGTIENFYGSSASRPVRFVSATGDTSTCKIEFQSNSASNRYVLTLNGAGFLHFDSLGIKNSDAGTNAGVIYMAKGTRNIHFNHCFIANNYSSSTVTASLISVQSGANGGGIFISNSVLQNGSNALWISGDKKESKFDGADIQNSHFINQGLNGIDASNTSNINLTNNSLSSKSSSSGYAISLQNTGGIISIEQNEVISTGNWPRRALNISGSAGMLNRQNRIVNNVFKLADTISTSKYHGIYLDTVAFYLVAHNTVAIEGTDNGSTALTIANSGGNSITNNILANFGAGLSVDYSGAGSILTSNYNNLYASGIELASFGGSAEADLQNWQIAAGLDLNSVSANPSFNSRLDLHPCGANLDNTGTPIASITRDFGGIIRHTLHPDPGAFEFASPTKFDVGNTFNICGGDSFILSPSVGSNDLLIWNASDTGFTFQTSTAGTYTVINLSSCGIGMDTFMVQLNTAVNLPNDTNICMDDTLNLQSQISGVHNWNDGSMLPFKRVFAAGRYSVEVIDSNGCYSTDTIIITRSMKVKLPGDTTLCKGNSVQLNPQTGAGIYAWSNGSSSPVIFADSTGIYSLTFTDVLGCTSMGSTRVTVMDVPKGGFTSKQSQSNIQFTARDTTATGYHWSFGDGKSANGAWRAVNVYPSNGSYKVTLTISNMCGAVIYDSTLEIGTIGLNESQPFGYTVYPNPVTSILTINHYNTDVLSWHLNDAMGRQIPAPYRMNKSGYTQFDLEGLCDGFYTVTGTTKDGYVYLKIIKR